MLAFQKSFKSLESLSNIDIDFDPDIFLVFISPLFLERELFLKELSSKFPDAIITGCSTAGEIRDISVEDNTIVLNALKFNNTRLEMISANVVDFENCIELGKEVIGKLEKESLKHVLVFSEGLMVNGDDLVTGLTSDIIPGVGITGGLAGDGTDFNNTFVIKNDKMMIGEVVIVGMYGTSLKVGYSSVGGWNSFGIERKVTRSDKNILYEIDGQPALQLYKSFLGEKAEGLPGTGLLFPLSLRLNETSKPLVRTLLNVDEKEQSITFAGNIPEGSFVRLMKANMDRLISGAEKSAHQTKEHLPEEVDFALLVSCVGRRVVLKQIVEEEIEAVRDVLGEKPIISGFYSYGELAPFGQDGLCKLHNQTMTITTFSESL